MRIVSYLGATTNFDIAWEEIRPLDGRPFTVTQNAIKERYNFQNTVQSPTAQAHGLLTPFFQAGSLPSDPNVTFNQLDFQMAAVSIGAATTKQTLMIADDLFEFLHTSLGFRAAPTGRKATYSSIIIADVGPAVANIFGRWGKIMTFIQGFAREGTEILPVGLKFMTFQGRNVLLDPQFTFERRVPSPAGENWIYSSGPFDTESHETLLEMIEQEFRT